MWVLWVTSSDDKIPNPEIALMTSFSPPGELDVSAHSSG
jgi:hypothetical protein